MVRFLLLESAYIILNFVGNQMLKFVLFFFYEGFTISFLNTSIYHAKVYGKKSFTGARNLKCL